MCRRCYTLPWHGHHGAYLAGQNDLHARQSMAGLDANHLMPVGVSNSLDTESSFVTAGIVAAFVD